MRNRTLMILVVSFNFISSCAVQKEIRESNRLQTPNETSIQKEASAPICVYREMKGIAEVIRINPESIYFRFYPGDDSIAVSTETIANAEDLQIGDELMATKKYLTNDHPGDCLPVELIVRQP